MWKWSNSAVQKSFLNQTQKMFVIGFVLGFFSPVFHPACQYYCFSDRAHMSHVTSVALFSCRELKIACAQCDAARDTIYFSLALDLGAICLSEQEGGNRGSNFIKGTSAWQRAFLFKFCSWQPRFYRGGGLQKRKENIFYACMFLISGHVMVCLACWWKK